MSGFRVYYMRQSAGQTTPSVAFLTQALYLMMALLPVAGACLPMALSFSLIHTSPNAASYEEIVSCSYLQALQYDGSFFVPITAFVLMVLFAVTVALSFFIHHRAVDIAVTALSAASLLAVLSLIFLQGLERFTPTSLAMAFLLLCSLVVSVQRLTGWRFIDPTQEDDE